MSHVLPQKLNLSRMKSSEELFSMLSKSSAKIVIIDEIQAVPEWRQEVDKFVEVNKRTKRDMQIIISGSRASFK